MTMDEYKASMEEMAVKYGALLRQESPDANALGRIEAALKKAKIDAHNQRAQDIISDAMGYTNPIVEGARNAEFTYPSYKMVRENGIVTGISIVNAVGQVKAVDLCKTLAKASEMSGHPYEKSGVVKNGAAWEYAAKKMAFLMAQRVAGGLEISAEKMAELEAFYKLPAEARKVDLGKDPFSSRQMVKTLQGIIDKLAFVPNEKGENAIKVMTCDVKYLTEIFAKAGATMGDVKTLKGQNMAQYIFTILHMIVAGKAYTVDGVGGGKSARGEIPVSQKIVRAAKIDEAKATEGEPDAIVIERTETAEATENTEAGEVAA